MASLVSVSSATSGTKRTWDGEKKTGVAVYAVFETTFNKDYQYLIYKLDPPTKGSAAGKDLELGPPICGIKKSNSSTMNMSIFSAGSNLYFCGGYRYETGNSGFPFFFEDAYRLDISTLISISNSGDGNVIVPVDLIPIESMKSPKGHACVFGPIDDHKVYVFTPTLSQSSRSSFECLDARTNEWESLPLPPTDDCYTSDLAITASVISGSFICLSTLSGLFVFATKSNKWFKFNRPYFSSYSFQPYYLPFHGLSQSLSFKSKNENENGTIVLAPSARMSALPKVYKLPPFVEPKEDFGRDYFFAVSGEEVGGLKEEGEEVEGFKEHWKGRRDVIINFFSVFFNDEPGVCVVHSDEYYDDKGEPRGDKLIDICNVSLSGGAKVKVQNSVTYKHHSYDCMEPRHFFVA